MNTKNLFISARIKERISQLKVSDIADALKRTNDPLEVAEYLCTKYILSADDIFEIKDILTEEK